MFKNQDNTLLNIKQQLVPFWLQKGHFTGTDIEYNNTAPLYR